MGKIGVLEKSERTGSFIDSVVLNYKRILWTYQLTTTKNHTYVRKTMMMMGNEQQQIAIFILHTHHPQKSVSIFFFQKFKKQFKNDVGDSRLHFDVQDQQCGYSLKARKVYGENEKYGECEDESRTCSGEGGDR
tara:strand:+ start:1003 stop:1404 length:402 start_codon:yes stop_codon:yes gene_type:complete